jgi:S-DNA-T family DNA segregation ATPase FtsK/SpoIIIE
MIVSILYKAKPDEVKFILMDPKKVELATYKSLVGYHLITAPNLDEYVMTTAENAVAILDSAIVEMERRFQIFSEARVRNITEYHDRRKENPNLESIPFVVVVIDELADLILTSGRAIEEPITRLAQKARAVGIHLVLATQRPSVDVITGLIKSNFPARISFQVSSKVDSRTILDQMGAEKLLGRGDMLFLLPGTASPIRLHNAYVTLDEIEAIMEHIEEQPKPEEMTLPETRKEKLAGDFSLDEDQDELLHDAAKLVTQTQQASVSLLQRKFRIGYSRAGRLVDELESLGIVSGYSGSKAREVLVDESYLDNIFNE